MYFIYHLLVLFIVFYAADSQNLRQRRQVITPCDLPPDFWCDHPETSITCTGSVDFCQKYRVNRVGRPWGVELAFETACPDSQQYVVNHLYPKLLTNTALSSIIDFKALPWGLAERDSVARVDCHHGERECIGNRLLRAALFHLRDDKPRRNTILNCFMTRMMYRPLDPTSWMAQCLDSSRVAGNLRTAVLNNSNTTAPDLVSQEKADEAATHRIAPKFVPYIAINGRSHIHMQAYQIMLIDKLQAWNHTLASIPARTIIPSNCQVPPDFWCADGASFSTDCYTARGCSDYIRMVFNKPVHLRVLYNSQAAASQRYIFGYLRYYFLTRNAFDLENGGKFVLELEPIAVAGAPNISSNVNCTQQPLCLRQAYEECIMMKISNVRERTSQIVCLLTATQAANLTTMMVDAAWKNCSRVRDVRKTIENCVQSSKWRQSFSRRAVAQQALRPQPPQWSPWIVLNSDHSLVSVQSFNHLLHRMICVWYRGAGHDRNFCARCEYEPTHC